MTATDLYTGDGGRWYWRRNFEAVRAAGRLRRVALRGLVEAPARKLPWLELGCGSGANLLPGDVGIDCDPRILRCGHVNVTALLGDARSLPFLLDGSFAVVLSVGLLMHFPPADALQVVTEMARLSWRYVLTGEYEAEKEIDLLWNPKTGNQGRGTPGLLWSRPYGPLMDKAGLVLVDSKTGLAGFEPAVTFSVWRRKDVGSGAAVVAGGDGAAGAGPGAGARRPAGARHGRPK